MEIYQGVIHFVKLLMDGLVRKLFCNLQIVGLMGLPYAEMVNGSHSMVKNVMMEIERMGMDAALSACLKMVTYAKLSRF